MARVLLTTMQVSSAGDTLLRPLIDDGHELVLLPANQARQEELLCLAQLDAAGHGVEHEAGERLALAQHRFRLPAHLRRYSESGNGARFHGEALSCIAIAMHYNRSANRVIE